MQLVSLAQAGHAITHDLLSSDGKMFIFKFVTVAWIGLASCLSQQVFIGVMSGYFALKYLCCVVIELKS